MLIGENLTLCFAGRGMAFDSNDLNIINPEDKDWFEVLKSYAIIPLGAILQGSYSVGRGRKLFLYVIKSVEENGNTLVRLHILELPYRSTEALEAEVFFSLVYKCGFAKEPGMLNFVCHSKVNSSKGYLIEVCDGKVTLKEYALALQAYNELRGSGYSLFGEVPSSAILNYAMYFINGLKCILVFIDEVYRDIIVLPYVQSEDSKISDVHAYVKYWIES